jgi:hypothetical protein
MIGHHSSFHPYETEVRCDIRYGSKLHIMKAPWVTPNLLFVLERGQLQSRTAWGKAESHCVGREWAPLGKWRRRDKAQHPYCDMNLGHTVPVSTIASVYLATLSTAQTNKTIHLADSNELTRLCSEGSGRGLIKIVSLHLSGWTEDILA